MTAALAPTAPGQQDSPTPIGPAPSTGRRRPYLVPVPDCEPPFDDEATTCPHHGGRSTCPAGDDEHQPFTVRHGSWHATAPAGPLRTLRPGVPHLTAVRPAPHRVPTPDSPSRAGRGDQAVGPRPGSAEHSARMLARALVEVLAGHRPAQQLRGFCTPAVFATLQRADRMRLPALPHVLSVRVCEPAAGVAEVAAVYRRGDRVRMVAFRMERPTEALPGLDGRWTIGTVQAG